MPALCTTVCHGVSWGLATRLDRFDPACVLCCAVLCTQNNLFDGKTMQTWVLQNIAYSLALIDPDFPYRAHVNITSRYHNLCTEYSVCGIAFHRE